MIEAGKWSGIVQAAIVVAILAVAAALRIYGIEAESFWHDEACSMLTSDNSVSEVLRENAIDVHPPLFFLGLHFWRMAFGDRDGFVRAYSVLWSLIGLIGVYLLAREIGGPRAGLIALLLGAVNPLDIYFAQETRMYTQTAAFAIFAAWCLWRWMAAPAIGRRGWPWAVGYAGCTAGMLYSHHVSVLIVVAQGFFALGWFAWHRRWSGVAGLAAAAVGVMLAFLPWFLFVRRVRPTFYNPALDWIGMPRIGDYWWFLGNEYFWGYGVAPLRMSVPTFLLALAVIGIALRGGWKRRNAARLDPARGAAGPGVIFPFWIIAGSMICAGVAAEFYHPVFYRPRFAELILPAFLVLAGLGCAALRRSAAVVLAAVLAGAMLWGGWLQLNLPQKPDWRSLAKLWKEKGPRGRTIFFPPYWDISTAHYLDEPLTWIPRAQAERMLPSWKGQDVWIVWDAIDGFDCFKDDYDYYQWLINQGTVRHISLPHCAHVQVLTVGGRYGPDVPRFDRWFAALEYPKRLTGFSDTKYFSTAFEVDGATGMAYQWSKARGRLCLQDCDRAATLVLNVQLPPPAIPNYRPELKFYAIRSTDGEGLFESEPLAAIDEFRPGAFNVSLQAPTGVGFVYVGWRVNPINLAKAGVAKDDRDLGLRLNWLGVIKRP